MNTVNKYYLKRQSIFKIYSENLKLYAASRNFQLAAQSDDEKYHFVDYDIYLCPLCLCAFNINAIKGNNPILTIEHCPPKSMGGKPLVLTCKECNNSFGTKSDIHLLNTINKEPFLNMELNSTMEMDFKFGEMPIKGAMELIGGNKLLIKFKSNSNPYHLPKIEELLRGKKGEFKFQFATPKRDVMKKATMKSAYLYMFSIFGYSFVLDKNIKKIRESLLSNTDLVPYNVIGDNLPDEEIGLSIINSPTELYNYLLVLPIKTKTVKKNIGIIFPTGKEVGWQNYLNWSALINNVTTTNTYFENYSGIREDKSAYNDFYLLEGNI